jgi:UDP:flavonoid glycosyltransferase YjiC (YdhE family)
MKLAIFTLGSRGDIQPYVALAKGFKARGHDVRIISDESAEALAAQHGIDGHYLGGDLRKLIDMPALHRRRRNPMRFARALANAFARLAAGWPAAAAEAAAGSDMLLTSASSYGMGRSIAEKLNIPSCEANTLPYTPTGYLPPVLLPWPGLFPQGAGTKLAHEAMQRAVWLGARPAVDDLRRQLGLAPWRWPFGPKFSSSAPILLGFSPQLVPRPPDWPANVSVTGCWYHRSDADWRPPADLARFLAAGEKPIYIGFGSMIDRDPQGLTQILVQTVANLGVRAVLARSWGWGDPAGYSQDPNIFLLNEAPHEWLFPRMAALVHHGGAGTAGAAARSGVPSVVVPYIADQPYFGWRLERLGVAPRALPRSRLTARSLTEAIGRALRDKDMQRRATALALASSAEDGIGVAAKTIEAWNAFSKRIQKGPRRQAAS